MAFEYHGFVTELAMVAAVEADWAGRPLSEDTWALLYRMFNVVAATVDVALRSPRQGDGDDGKALVLDPPTAERSPGLLAIGEGPFRAPGWWPSVEATVDQHPPGRRWRASTYGEAPGTTPPVTTPMPA